MAKATITLPNGTQVVVEGSVDEVNALLAFYGGTSATPAIAQNKGPKGKSPRKQARSVGGASTAAATTQDGTADVSEIVNLVKNCDEAESIETHVLDRTSLVDRTLLPLYIVHEYQDDAFALSSGEISRVTTQLGVPVAQPNVSRTLSGSASRYVIGDRVRVKGMQVRYKLSRRGLQYMQSVISGKAGEK